MERGIDLCVTAGRDRQFEQAEAAPVRRVAYDALEFGRFEALYPPVRPMVGQLGRILRRVCRVTGVPASEIRSQRRGRQVVFARQMYCYWAIRLTSLSFPQVGRSIGRDHTTVLHAVGAYADKRAYMGRRLRPVRNFAAQVR